MNQSMAQTTAQPMAIIASVLRDSKERHLEANARLPIHLDYRLEATYAHQQIERTLDRGRNSLVNANPDSIRFAFLEAAGFGLTLELRKQRAFLIPRWDSAVGELRCHLDVGYRGFQFLAARAGLTQLSIELVYDKDEFEYNGPDQPVVHRFKSLSSDPEKRGALAGGYAMARFGNTLITTPVSPEHLLSVQQDAIHNARGFTPWTGPYVNEMLRKTICRKAWKDWEHQLMQSDIKACYADVIKHIDEESQSAPLDHNADQLTHGAQSSAPQQRVEA
ncbi:recombinase RecT [Neiella sp. HB171785]|uniref:Recombinase RecT n=1 Tax=Neiella litorisoli TaxID=2771431 RepID=A0A8J6UIY0_9GAMM|nr:recombinase RecT [Neiella litorisoli]MBD1389418.1 recombinase RecT [Neiella litorisoli]